MPGKPLSVAVEGSADSPTRLFAYIDPYAFIEPSASWCAPQPHQEQADRPRVSALSSLEGEGVGPGRYSTAYTYTPAGEGVYRVCAYLDSSSEALPVLSGTLVLAVGPVGEYLLSGRGESQPLGSRTELLPGAIEPAPVNLQLMQEYWEHVAREAAGAQERERAKSLAVKAKPCIVPPLLGHTLGGAKWLLVRAHCSLARLERSSRRAPRGLVVRSQRPAAGHVLAAGAPVSVRLGVRASRR